MWTALIAYKSSGADELRSSVYQPLFSDLSAIKFATQALSAEAPPTAKSLPGLQQSGAFVRVPRRLRDGFRRTVEDASALHGRVAAFREVAIRQMSARMMNVRTEEMDRIWRQRAVNALQNLAAARPGMYDSVTMTLSHESRCGALL